MMMSSSNMVSFFMVSLAVPKGTVVPELKGKGKNIQHRTADICKKNPIFFFPSADMCSCRSIFVTLSAHELSLLKMFSRSVFHA